MTLDPRKLLDSVWEHGHLPLACLAAGVLGYLLHRPAVRVEEREKVVVQEKVVTQRVEVASAAKTTERVVYRTRIIRPDGTREEREAIQEGTQATSATQSTTAQTAVASSTSEASRVVTPAPSWSASLLVGVEPLHLLTPRAYGPLELGAMVQWRPLGSIWVGPWGLWRGGTDFSLGVAGGFQW